MVLINLAQCRGGKDRASHAYCQVAILPMDSQAIAFKCKVDGAWYPIGYVVKEALSEVHAAINDKAITNVAFSWVKFVIYWKKPGWYAGINITRIGEWSHKVVTSQSAKM